MGIKNSKIMDSNCIINICKKFNVFGNRKPKSRQMIINNNNNNNNKNEYLLFDLTWKIDY